MSKIKTFPVTVAVSLLAFLALSDDAYAVIHSLNGLTVQHQTFQNDTNFTITSAGSIHTLNWSGLLPISRGGTGKSSFAEGSIPFVSSGVFSESPELLFDSSQSILHVPIVQGGLRGGPVDVSHGNAVQFINSDGIRPWVELFSEADNTLNLFGEGIEFSAILDLKNLTTDRTFGFPDTSGTFGLLEADQSFTGLNKFEASTNSTIYVGSSTDSGCIALGDSDGAGVTYVTANDGILMASFTKPSICQ